MISDNYKNLAARVVVLFRAPDTLTLYGIPYEMREGQQPGDLWRGRTVPAPPWYSRLLGATMPSPGPREDWIYLGAPGWWGTFNNDDKDAAYAFLASIPKDLIPGGPYEWCHRIEMCPTTCDHVTFHYCGESGTHCDKHCACPCRMCREEATS